MLLTEGEARGKTCHRSIGTFNEIQGPGPFPCVASDCMVWREKKVFGSLYRSHDPVFTWGAIDGWAVPSEPECFVTNYYSEGKIDTITEYQWRLYMVKGFCGLAGKVGE